MLMGVRMSQKTYRTRARECTCRMAVCRCPVDYIVYYAPESEGEWIVERTSDKAEVARGSLQDMMALVDGDNPKFPNGRRAHLAEDLPRIKPGVFGTEYEYPVK